MKSPALILPSVRRRLLIHRRALAALCAATAALLALRVVAGPETPTIPVWTAARDVPSGSVLQKADFRRTGYAAGSVPPAAVRDLSAVVGRTLATPLDAGEPVSLGKLLGPGRLAGYPGRSAVAVRIQDGALASVLHSGDQVDLLHADPRGTGPALRVARGAVVLTTVKDADRGFSEAGGNGRLIVFAVAPEEVDALAAAPTSGFLTAAWNR